MSDLSQWNDEMYEKYPTRRGVFHFNPIPRFIEYARMRSVLKGCGDVKGKRILEIGCEQGILTARIPEGYKELIATDISPRALEDAKKFCKKPRIKFLVRDATKKMEFSENHFDIIICSETLEHVPDYMAVVKEMHRLLRPAGRLSLSVPYEKSITSAKRFLTKLKIFDLLFTSIESHTSEWHVNQFDKASICQALEDYFSITRAKYVPFPFIGPKIIVIAQKKIPQ